MKYIIISLIILLTAIYAISLPNITKDKTIEKEKAVSADTVPGYALTEDQNRTEPALFAPGIISTGDDDAHATFTADGRTVYFVKSTPQFNHWTTVVSHFQNGHWSTPEVVSFSGRYRTGGVAFSQDSSRLFFVSNRPVKKGDPHKEETDIWMVRKTSGGWGEPEHIPVLSSPRNEWFPTVTDDGTIYFGSERRDGNLGPDGTTDLWRSEWVDGHYTEPENLGNVINTSGEDIEGYIARDESFLIFSSDAHKENYGLYDLYISYYQNGIWSQPQNLGDTINSAGWEFGPKLSPDGNYLFFTSNRSFFDEPLKQRLDYRQLINKIRGPGNGLRDIYQIKVDMLPSPGEE